MIRTMKGVLLVRQKNFPSKRIKRMNGMNGINLWSMQEIYIRNMEGKESWGKKFSLKRMNEWMRQEIFIKNNEFSL